MAYDLDHEFRMEVSRADQACRDFLIGQSPARAWVDKHARAVRRGGTLGWYRAPNGWTCHRFRDSASTWFEFERRTFEVQVVRYLCGRHVAWCHELDPDPWSFTPEGFVPCRACDPSAPRPCLAQQERVRLRAVHSQRQLVRYAP